jgi:hypothetical protein
VFGIGDKGYMENRARRVTSHENESVEDAGTLCLNAMGRIGMAVKGRQGWI